MILQDFLFDIYDFSLDSHKFICRKAGKKFREERELFMTKMHLKQ